MLIAPNALSELKAKFKSLLKGGKKTKKADNPTGEAKPAVTETKKVEEPAKTEAAAPAAAGTPRAHTLSNYI